MGAPLALAHLFSILPEAVAQAMGRGAAKAGLVQLATATQSSAASSWGQRHPGQGLNAFALLCRLLPLALCWPAVAAYR